MRNKHIVRNKSILAFTILLFVSSCSPQDSITLSPSIQAPPAAGIVSPELEPPPLSAPQTSPAPELDPMPNPPQSPEPAQVVTPSPTPAPPSPLSLFQAHCLPETDPDGMNYRYDVLSDGKIVTDYSCPDRIAFDLPDTYTSLGITTFRGNNFRDNAAWGNVSGGKLTELYSFKIGYIDKWTGTGWTGQPSIVRWERDVMRHMNIKPEKMDRAELIEVIYGTMDGKIYFFDLEDGAPTRDPIVLGEPIKGSVTVDPRGYPILYVGQGVRYKSRMGYYIYSLLDGGELAFINGMDPFAKRGWGAFDANPLIDAKNDRMFLCGENGVIYNIKLNTDFNREAGALAIDPRIVRYRYTARSSGYLGIESSPSAFSHYLFTADNSGIVQCVDLAAFQPVWARSCTDDTDSSVVLDWEAENQRLSLYTACEVDHQGPGGFSYIRKLDASCGELLWEHKYPCLHDPDVNGGVLATPVVGMGDLSGYVFFWIAKVRGMDGGGVLACFDKYTGEIAWENIMPFYGWSSPVALYKEDGTGYLVVCDFAGSMYLIRGATGEILDKIPLGANIEASPAAYGNTIVVGTRGMKIYGIAIS